MSASQNRGHAGQPSRPNAGGGALEDLSRDSGSLARASRGDPLRDNQTAGDIIRARLLSEAPGFRSEAAVCLMEPPRCRPVLFGPALSTLNLRRVAMNVQSLQGCRVLVVEDDYFLAEELCAGFRESGAEVIGPVGELEAALALIDRQPRLQGAVLDINLRGEMVFPVADQLTQRGIPF